MQVARARNALRLGLSLLQRGRHELRTQVPSERRKCVLIVVEDRLAGRHLARLLTAKGYERVRVVRRAASALLLAEKCSPGIVFLDVALSDNEEARSAGFERWLVTPVVKDELDGLMRREGAAPE